MHRLATAVVLLNVTLAAGREPCTPGLQPGQKIGPYSFLVATGPQRGQQTCYVCETGEKPAAVIFARRLTEPLGQLAVAVDAWQSQQPKDSARAWMTVLGEKTATLDELAKWAKEAGLKALPVGVFDDPIGPPAFKLNPDAETIVLVWVNRKITAGFAFRAGELNADALAEIRKALPQAR